MCVHWERRGRFLFLVAGRPPRYLHGSRRSYLSWWYLIITAQKSRGYCYNKCIVWAHDHALSDKLVTQTWRVFTATSSRAVSFFLTITCRACRPHKQSRGALSIFTQWMFLIKPVRIVYFEHCSPRVGIKRLNKRKKKIMLSPCIVCQNR